MSLDGKFEYVFLKEFAESLKRLYNEKRITDKKLLDLVKRKKITEEEYAYITQKQ